MKLTPTPHPLSAQGKFEAHMLRNGWRLGALAISGDRYCNDEVQSAWHDWLGEWLGEPFQSPEPFQSEETFSSGEFQVSDSLAQHSVVYDEEE